MSLYLLCVDIKAAVCSPEDINKLTAEDTEQVESESITTSATTLKTTKHQTQSVSILMMNIYPITINEAMFHAFLNL